jgi:iron(III) transport system permease protein
VQLGGKAASQPRPKSFLPTFPSLVGAVLLIIVGYLVVPPVLVLLYGSVTSTPPGVWPEFTIATLAEAYSNPRILAALWRSLIFASCTATAALVIGAFLAWLVERTEVRVRTLTDLATLVPLLLPAVLLASGWILLLTPNHGTINALIKWMLGANAPQLDIFSFPGMIWVATLQELPLAFLWLWPTFRAMNPELEEAAVMSGATNATTLLRITLPLLWPTLAAAWIIFFITALGALAVPLLIGLPAGIFLYSTEIYLAASRAPANLNLASAYALLFLAIAALGVYANRVVTGDATRFAVITGRAYRARRVAVGPTTEAALLLLVLLVLLLAAGLPLAVLVWNAFMPFPQPPSLSGLSRATLKNFVSAWNYGPATRAALNSLILGLGAGVITTVIGALVAWGLWRQKKHARMFGLLDFMCTLPIAVPGLIVGVSLVWLYLALPVPIYGTPWILLLAYVTLHLPFALRICSSAMGQLHPELEEAAHMAGASAWRTFWRITGPLIAPGMAVSVVYIAIRSFREYQASIFLTSVGSEVFAIIVLDMADGGNSTILAAYASVVIVGLSLGALALFWIGRRSGVRV